MKKTNPKKIEEFIRVDHAGERGAIKIYEGQLLALNTIVKNEDFKIVKGEDKLSLYQFHTKVAKHYFCSICGIYTHHHPRINPALTGFNLGCIDEINTFDLDNISIANRFPSAPPSPGYPGGIVLPVNCKSAPSTRPSPS